MTWKIVYSDIVTQDVREAKNWYFKQRKGLEKRFSEDVKECLTRLKKDPFHYEIRYKHVRLAYCRIFPYAVHYYIDETSKQLVVIAILHQHRHPVVAKNR